MQDFRKIPALGECSKIIKYVEDPGNALDRALWKGPFPRNPPVRFGC
jgi:hypothetical protein